MYDILHCIKVIADNHKPHRLLDNTDFADLPGQNRYKRTLSKIVLFPLDDNFSDAVQYKQEARFLMKEWCGWL